MSRVEVGRRSAKGTITAYAEELLARRNDPDVHAKLLAVETIALRMNWHDLYNKLRFKSGLHAPVKPHWQDAY